MNSKMESLDTLGTTMDSRGMKMKSITRVEVKKVERRAKMWRTGQTGNEGRQTGNEGGIFMKIWEVQQPQRRSKLNLPKIVIR